MKELLVTISSFLILAIPSQAKANVQKFATDISPCAASGDCSREAQIGVVQVFCQENGFEGADDYGIQVSEACNSMAISRGMRVYINLRVCDLRKGMISNAWRCEWTDKVDQRICRGSHKYQRIASVTCLKN